MKLRIDGPCVWFITEPDIPGQVLRYQNSWVDHALRILPSLFSSPSRFAVELSSAFRNLGCFLSALRLRGIGKSHWQVQTPEHRLGRDLSRVESWTKNLDEEQAQEYFEWATR
jgi:hypothetical protein